MKKPFLLTTSVLAVSLLLASCSAQDVEPTSSAGSTVSTSSFVVGVNAETVLAENQSPHDDENDETWDASSEVTITLADGASTTTSDTGVEVDGETVTITQAGTYRITGELTAGQVVVNSTGEGIVRLILDGASITNPSGAAIEITEADKALVYLSEGTENFLSDADSYPDDADAKAALSSAADLTIGGQGTLTVVGNGNDAISSKDGLVITGGTLNISSVDDGIRGQDYVVVRSGLINITAEGDGITSDNEEDADRGYIAIMGGETTIDAGADGLDAFTDLVATAGTLNVTTGGGSQQTVADDASAKGLKGRVQVVIEGVSATVDAAEDAVHSDGGITVADGTLTLAAGDDAVHADLALLISGGTTTITNSVEGLESADIEISGGENNIVASDDGINVSEGSSTEGSSAEGSNTEDSNTDSLELRITGGNTVVAAEGDGIDSNGSITMSGGNVTVHGPTGAGNGSLDYDGSFTISGGELIALGSSGMVQTPSAESTQATVAFTLSQSVGAGTKLSLQDANGTVLATVTTEKTAQSVILSNDQVVDSQTYTLTADGEEVASAEAGVATNQGPGGGQGGPGNGSGNGPGGDRPEGGTPPSDQ